MYHNETKKEKKIVKKNENFLNAKFNRKETIKLKMGNFKLKCNEKCFSNEKKKKIENLIVLYVCLPVERVVPATFIEGVIDVDVMAAVTTIIEAVC